jgi:hypothetical protein
LAIVRVFVLELGTAILSVIKSGHHQKKQLLQTTEMNTLRAILGKTGFDRMKNIDILKQCNIQAVTKFVKSRRKAWNEHVGRAEQRLIKLVIYSIQYIV